MSENYLVQTLIESKDFESLTSEERKIVLQEITEEEFRSRKLMLDNVKLFLQEGVNNSKPRESIKRNAIAIMEGEKRDSVLNKIVLFRIPAYVAAASLALLLGTYYFMANTFTPVFYFESVVKTNNRKEKIIYKTDTVYLEKEIPVTVIQKEVQYVTVEKKEICTSETLDLVKVKNEESVLETLNEPATFTTTKLESQLNVIGKPTSLQSELNKFVAVGN